MIHRQLLIVFCVGRNTKAKSQLEADLEANTEEKGATTKTLMATLEHIQSLHAECDWLLQYYQDIGNTFLRIQSLPSDLPPSVWFEFSLWANCFIALPPSSDLRWLCDFPGCLALDRSV